MLTFEKGSFLHMKMIDEDKYELKDEISDLYR